MGTCGYCRVGGAGLRTEPRILHLLGKHPELHPWLKTSKRISHDTHSLIAKHFNLFLTLIHPKEL